ncbi:MAG: hypothetical protein Ct9H300mP13_4290 [Gammaproteobacteria bacterium]|nr:MAG: hypothetical protein Ct9H300mP13_4290 [Gammaproteobacteria bacterium]
MLGHVQDLGQSFDDPYSRGPYTHERIEYHSDACDIVGLLCLCPAAQEVKESRKCRPGVQRTQRQRPDLLRLCYNRSTETAWRNSTGQGSWYAFPVFNFSDGPFVNNEPHISILWPGFLHKTQTPAQHEGLALLEKLAHENHIEIPFEGPGTCSLLTTILFFTQGKPLTMLMDR